MYLNHFKFHHIQFENPQRPIKPWRFHATRHVLVRLKIHCGSKKQGCCEKGGWGGFRVLFLLKGTQSAISTGKGTEHTSLLLHRCLFSPAHKFAVCCMLCKCEMLYYSPVGLIFVGQNCKFGTIGQITCQSSSLRRVNSTTTKKFTISIQNTVYGTCTGTSKKIYIIS